MNIPLYSNKHWREENVENNLQNSLRAVTESMSKPILAEPRRTFQGAGLECVVLPEPLGSAIRICGLSLLI